MDVYDGHIHLSQWQLQETSDDVEAFLEKLHAAGIIGGVVISSPPANVVRRGRELSDRQRIEELMIWRQGRENLFPFFWIDPIADDALEQVDQAIAQGVVAFKIICDRYFVHDPTAMRTIRAIAERGCGILFHSGILWDGKPSSAYSQPREFEALLTVPNLRFVLAHVGWPWYDECIAVYGKFLNAQLAGDDESPDMFIDLAPGTPELYRREVLHKLFNIGYDVKHGVLFATDGLADDYSVSWARRWLAIDNQLYQEMNIDADTLVHIYEKNLRRFVLNDPPTVERTLPQQAV